LPSSTTLSCFVLKQQGGVALSKTWWSRSTLCLKNTEELVPRSFQAAQGWIRYAVQHEVKSLILKLELPWIYEDRLAQGGHEHPVMAIDELATYAKLDTMHLRLGFAQLELSFSSSSMVVFTSLTDLSLEDTTVAGHLLSRLVSSPSCSRLLRKLRLEMIFTSLRRGTCSLRPAYF